SGRRPSPVGAAGGTHLRGAARRAAPLARAAEHAGQRPRAQGGLTVSVSLTRAADRARPMPDSLAARQNEIARAVRSLADERRRLERLGLERPLARCHHETRYWGFLAAMFALPSRPGPVAGHP